MFKEKYTYCSYIFVIDRKNSIQVHCENYYWRVQEIPIKV